MDRSALPSFERWVFRPAVRTGRATLSASGSSCAHAIETTARIGRRPLVQHHLHGECRPVSCITSRRILHTPSIPRHRLVLRMQSPSRCAQRRDRRQFGLCVILIRVRRTHTHRWTRRALHPRDGRALSQEIYATFGSIPFEALLQVKIDGVEIGHQFPRGDECGGGIPNPVPVCLTETRSRSSHHIQRWEHRRGGEDTFPHAAPVLVRTSCPLGACGTMGCNVHDVEIGRETMEVIQADSSGQFRRA